MHLPHAVPPQSQYNRSGLDILNAHCIHTRFNEPKTHVFCHYQSWWVSLVPCCEDERAVRHLFLPCKTPPCQSIILINYFLHWILERKKNSPAPLFVIQNPSLLPPPSSAYSLQLSLHVKVYDLPARYFSLSTNVLIKHLQAVCATWQHHQNVKFVDFSLSLKFV